MTDRLDGSCLCGAVSVKAVPKNGQMDACHCSYCRKWSAGPFLSIACGSDVEFEGEENLSVFKSSEWAERSFCKKCGSVVAWRLQQGGEYHVSSQLFKDAEKLPFRAQIFIDQKPENYSFANETHTMTGEEVFAMFASGDDEAGA